MSFPLFLLIIILTPLLLAQTSYNPLTALSIYLTGNFTGQEQYGLFVTSKSSINGSIFQFADLTVENKLFLTIEPSSMSKTNITYQFSTSYTINGSSLPFIPTNLVSSDPLSCDAFTMFIDCTLTSSLSICSLLRAQDAAVKSSKPSTVSCLTTSGAAVCSDLISALNYTNFPSTSDYTSHMASCNGGTFPTTITVKTQIYVAMFSLPATQVMDTYNVSFHYMQLFASTTNDWLVTATQARLWDYPAKNITSGLSSAYNALPDVNTEYNTIYRTRLVTHNYTATIYCRYSLNFTGFVRAVYVNGYLGGIHAPNGTGFDGYTYSEATIRVPLYNRIPNIVTVMGYRLNNTQMNFMDCRATWNGQTVLNNIQFTYSYYNTTVYSSEERAPTTTAGACSIYCARCDKTVCYICKFGYDLLKGTCHQSCMDEAPYENSLKSCGGTPQNMGVLVEAPTITGDQVRIKGYLDVSDSDIYAMVIHPTNQMAFLSTPYTAINGSLSLAESHPILLQRTQGFYDLTISLSSIGSTSDPNSLLANVLYYNLAPSTDPTLPSFNWENSFETMPYSELMDPTVVSSHTLPAYDYLDSEQYYIYYTFLNCIQACTIQATSNGNVTLIRNDRTTLYNINFTSKWQYTYDSMPASFVHSQFKVRQSDYFQTNITGSNFTSYQPSPPYNSHILGPLQPYSPQCSISNCNNCDGTVCLSCNSGYYLTNDQASCVADCSALGYKALLTERKCVTSCTGQYVDGNATFCVPKCDQPGHIYVEFIGCKICVDDCLVCATATTCSQCQTYSFSANSTFCERKSGPVFTSSDFNVSQTIQFSANFSNTFAAIFTDTTVYESLSFNFLGNTRAIPRIIKAAKFNKTSASTGSLTVSPLSISESGNISINYVKIIKDKPVPTNITFIGYREKVYTDWPMLEPLPIVDPHNGYLSYETVNGLPLRVDKYLTTTITRLYQHNMTTKITCLGHTIFRGDIRKLYINGKMVFFDSTTRALTLKKEIYTKSVELAAYEMVVVTLIGYSFYWDIFNFTNCTDPNNNTVTPTFDSYMLSDQEAEPSLFYLNNNTYCSDNCKTCTDYSRCRQCADGYYLVNGTCQLNCASPYSRHSMYGFCDTTVRNQGNIYDSSYDSTADAIDLSIFVSLVSDTEVIIGAHPFNLTYTNHMRHERTVSYNSLARSTYQLVTILSSTPDFDVTVNLNNAVNASVFDYITIDLFIIKRNYIILAVWNTVPTTSAQNMEADRFEYVNIANNTLTLQADHQYLMIFFLDCSDSCTMTINMTGNIAVHSNDRTFILKQYFEADDPPFTIHRTFQGINYFIMNITNATSVQYSFGGTYSIYTLGQFVVSDVRKITAMVCTATNCLNCYKNKCYSCPQGYFLNSSNICEATCTNSYALQTERLCTTQSCASLNMILRNGTCIENCTAGIYYGTNGCDPNNLCYLTCQNCYGPAINQCTSCAWPRSLAANSSCICPPYSNDTSTGGCTTFIWITLTANSLVRSCVDLVLNASIAGAIDVSYSPTFYWQLDASSTVNTAAENAINAYLAAQTTGNISIPSSYLERNNTYNFTIYYMNTFGQRIENWTVVSTDGDYIFNFSASGGPTYTFNTFQQNTIQLVMAYDTCLNVAVPINTEWTLVGGDYIDINDLYDPQNPLQLSIPACFITSRSVSTLKAKVWLGDKIQFYKETQVNITFVTGTYTPVIHSSSIGEHYYTDPNLTLSATITIGTDCAITQNDNITYSWSCHKASSTGAAYLPCTDTNSLFNVSNTDNGLVIPRSYYRYNNGEIFDIGLTVSRNIDNAYSDFTINMVEKLSLSISISCQNCDYYNSNLEYLFSGPLFDSVSQPGMSYAWQTNLNIPFAAYVEQMKLYAQDPFTQVGPSNLIVTLTVENSTHRGQVQKIIPVNFAPQNGILQAIPSIGYSLITNFSLLTTNWQDVDTPFEYQFFYSFDEAGNFSALSPQYTLSNQLYTLLPAHGPSSLIYIQVVVKDNRYAESMAIANITVMSSATSLQDFLTTSQNIVNTAGSYSTSEQITLFSIIDEEASYWEGLASNSVSSSPCPGCSGKGVCPSGMYRCVCETGWSLADCSLQQSVFNQAITLKTEILTKLQNLLSQSDFGDNTDMIYQMLNKEASDINFNTADTLTMIQNILENQLNITDVNNILTLEQSFELSEILSSMLSYSRIYDCAGQTTFTQNLANITAEYLEVISRSTLSDKMPSENATFINIPTIDIYTDRISLCDLQNLTITTSANVPVTVLKLTDTTNLNCSEYYDLRYYVFTSNLISCTNTSTPTSKDTVGISITNTETGESLSYNVTVTIFMPAGKTCPSNCNGGSYIGCHCNDISVFDVKGQIMKMFGQSNLSAILQISNLLHFVFWKTAAFWGSLVLTMWFFITFYAIKVKVPLLDIVEKYKFSQIKTTAKKAKTMFLVTHPVLSIYYAMVPGISKAERAGLYYARSIMVLAFSSIFSDDDSSTSFISGLFNFNIYQFLLPYVTIIPIGHFLAFLLKPVSDSQLLTSRWIRYRRRLGYLLIIGTIAACLLVIIIIAASQTSSQQLGWAIDFVQMILQDIVLTPVFAIIVQYIVMKIVESNYMKNSPRTQKFLGKQVDKAFWDVQESSSFSVSSPIERSKPKANSLLPKNPRVYPISEQHAKTVQNGSVDEITLEPQPIGKGSFLNTVKRVSNVFRRKSVVRQSYIDKGQDFNKFDEKDGASTNRNDSRDPEAKEEQKSLDLFPLKINIKVPETLERNLALHRFSKRSHQSQRSSAEEEKSCETSDPTPGSSQVIGLSTLQFGKLMMSEGTNLLLSPTHEGMTPLNKSSLGSPFNFNMLPGQEDEIQGRSLIVDKEQKSQSYSARNLLNVPSRPMGRKSEVNLNSKTKSTKESSLFDLDTMQFEDKRAGFGSKQRLRLRVSASNSPRSMNEGTTKNDGAGQSKSKFGNEKETLKELHASPSMAEDLEFEELFFEDVEK